MGLVQSARSLTFLFICLDETDRRFSATLAELSGTPTNFRVTTPSFEKWEGCHNST